MANYYGDNYGSACPSYVSHASTTTTKTSVSSRYTTYTEGSEFEKISFIIGVKLVVAIITLIGGAILALCINVWMYYVSHASTTTTKTSVSSRYATYTEGSEFEKISFIIGVKLVVAIITLIGGSILALCINVWIKHTAAVPPDAKIFPGDDVENRGLMPYCQYQNAEIKLCLDDMQSSDTLRKGPIYLFHCHGFFATSQFFHHSKDGHISKPKNAMDAKTKDRMCLDVDDGKVVLNNCVDNKKEQNWMFYKSQRLFNVYFDKCLIAAKNREPVMLGSCSESSDQSWKCLEVNKNERLFNRYYQERNLTYPKHSEL